MNRHNFWALTSDFHHTPRPVHEGFQSLRLCRLKGRADVSEGGGTVPLPLEGEVMNHEAGSTSNDLSAMREYLADVVGSQVTDEQWERILGAAISWRDGSAARTAEGHCLNRFVCRMGGSSDAQLRFRATVTSGHPRALTIMLTKALASRGLPFDLLCGDQSRLAFLDQLEADIAAYTAVASEGEAAALSEIARIASTVFRIKTGRSALGTEEEFIDIERSPRTGLPEVSVLCIDEDGDILMLEHPLPIEDAHLARRADDALVILEAITRRAHRQDALKSLMFAISRDPLSTGQELARAACHPDELVRIGVAQHPNTDDGLLEWMAFDESPRVLQAVLANPSASDQTRTNAYFMLARATKAEAPPIF